MSNFNKQQLLLNIPIKSSQNNKYNIPNQQHTRTKKLPTTTFIARPKSQPPKQIKTTPNGFKIEFTQQGENFTLIPNQPLNPKGIKIGEDYIERDEPYQTENPHYLKTKSKITYNIIKDEDYVHDKNYTINDVNGVLKKKDTQNSYNMVRLNNLHPRISNNLINNINGSNVNIKSQEVIENQNQQKNCEGTFHKSRNVQRKVHNEVNYIHRENFGDNVAQRNFANLQNQIFQQDNENTVYSEQLHNQMLNKNLNSQNSINYQSTHNYFENFRVPENNLILESGQIQLDSSNINLQNSDRIVSNAQNLFNENNQVNYQDQNNNVALRNKTNRQSANNLGLLNNRLPNNFNPENERNHQTRGERISNIFVNGELPQRSKTPNFPNRSLLIKEDEANNSTQNFYRFTTESMNITGMTTIGTRIVGMPELFDRTDLNSYEINPTNLKIETERNEINKETLKSQKNNKRNFKQRSKSVITSKKIGIKKLQEEFLKKLKNMSQDLQNNYKNKLRQMNEEQQVQFLEKLLELKRKKLEDKNSIQESEISEINSKQKQNIKKKKLIKEESENNDLYEIVDENTRAQENVVNVNNPKIFKESHFTMSSYNNYVSVKNNKEGKLERKLEEIEKELLREKIKNKFLLENIKIKNKKPSLNFKDEKKNEKLTESQNLPISKNNARIEVDFIPETDILKNKNFDKDILESVKQEEFNLNDFNKQKETIHNEFQDYFRKKMSKLFKIKQVNVGSLEKKISNTEILKNQIDQNLDENILENRMTLNSGVQKNQDVLIENIEVKNIIFIDTKEIDSKNVNKHNEKIEFSSPDQNMAKNLDNTNYYNKEAHYYDFNHQKDFESDSFHLNFNKNISTEDKNRLIQENHANLLNNKNDHDDYDYDNYFDENYQIKIKKDDQNIEAGNNEEDIQKGNLEGPNESNLNSKMSFIELSELDQNEFNMNKNETESKIEYEPQDKEERLNENYDTLNENNKNCLKKHSSLLNNNLMEIIENSKKISLINRENLEVNSGGTNDRDPSLNNLKNKKDNFQATNANVPLIPHNFNLEELNGNHNLSDQIKYIPSYCQDDKEFNSNGFQAEYVNILNSNLINNTQNQDIKNNEKKKNFD